MGKCVVNYNIPCKCEPALSWFFNSFNYLQETCKLFLKGHLTHKMLSLSSPNYLLLTGISWASQRALDNSPPSWQAWFWKPKTEPLAGHFSFLLVHVHLSGNISASDAITPILQLRQNLLPGWASFCVRNDKEQLSSDWCHHPCYDSAIQLVAAIAY